MNEASRTPRVIAALVLIHQTLVIILTAILNIFYKNIVFNYLVHNPVAAVRELVPVFSLFQIWPIQIWISLGHIFQRLNVFYEPD